MERVAGFAGISAVILAFTTVIGAVYFAVLVLTTSREPENGWEQFDRRTRRILARRDRKRARAMVRSGRGDSVRHHPARHHLHAPR